MVYASFSDTHGISIDGFPLSCWIPMSSDYKNLSISVLQECPHGLCGRSAAGPGDPGHPKTPLALGIKDENTRNVPQSHIRGKMGSKICPSRWFQYVSELDTWTRGHAGNQDRPDRMIKKCSNHQVQAVRFLFNSILVSFQPKLVLIATCVH